jgi:hypothetical protein
MRFMRSTLTRQIRRIWASTKNATTTPKFSKDNRSKQTSNNSNSWETQSYNTRPGISNSAIVRRAKCAKLNNIWMECQHSRNERFSQSSAAEHVILHAYRKHHEDQLSKTNNRFVRLSFSNGYWILPWPAQLGRSI